MQAIDVGFLGYGTRALDALMADSNFNVKYFLTPKSRLCPEVFKAAEDYNFNLEIIDNKAQLTNRIKEIKNVTTFVMNACPFILTEEILSNMDFYNIHPGSLYTNRGHQPHLWTALLDERETEICIHKVNTEIDLGYVIEDVKISLKGNENSLEVLNLAEDEIPFLLKGLYKYLTGQTDIKYLVKSGTYRPIMNYSDYEITKYDSIEDIDRRIRTRFMHNGAFFVKDKKRIYVNKIISIKKGNESYFKYNESIAEYGFKGLKVLFNVKKIDVIN